MTMSAKPGPASDARFTHLLKRALFELRLAGDIARADSYEPQVLALLEGAKGNLRRPLRRADQSAVGSQESGVRRRRAMSADLERILGPDLLAALDERMRAIAREKRGADGDEWLSVKQACEVTSLGAWHARQLARKLLAEGSPDVYQPNPGRPPLRIRRSALRDLGGA
jgi:hypothetical protein